MKEKTSSLKKVESDRPSVCTCSGCQCMSASWNLRATVQKEATVLVLRATQATKFFTFYAQIWPLLSIHTLKSAIFFAAKVQISTSDSGPKWRFRTRKPAATFFLLFCTNMAALSFLQQDFFFFRY